MSQQDSFSRHLPFVCSSRGILNVKSPFFHSFYRLAAVLVAASAALSRLSATTHRPCRLSHALAHAVLYSATVPSSLAQHLAQGLHRFHHLAALLALPCMAFTKFSCVNKVVKDIAIIVILVRMRLPDTVARSRHDHCRAVLVVRACHKTPKEIS